MYEVSSGTMICTDAFSLKNEAELGCNLSYSGGRRISSFRVFVFNRQITHKKTKKTKRKRK
jgi:hypothetical protein